ncbi:hypothetical protein [Rugosimonospora africana]|uniref:Uncharacterized protein n=1 Tax=Rugosimonospora africana TaxID=556532 RepID=A0A8J3QR15_9ACTN|nr:hypothetical protein [Rugosimonospora africana]GIH14090.1 hypothetical protein Raf01_22620 [Rugosimonospora africana]
MSARFLARTAGHLQRSQLSVQAVSRLSSVVVFLLASWTDGRHLALVALQGALFAIPYTLIEALVGRPLSAGLVPAEWNVDRWARRAGTAAILPVAVVAYLSAAVALPHTGPVSRLLMITPVLVQLPLEAAFWSLARTRSREYANLVPQLVSAGTVLAGAAFAVLHVRIDLAALPAQVIVLGWVLLRKPSPAAGQVRPPIWRSVRIGAAYCLAAGVDLVYTVALPSVAGRLVGPQAIVVLRAMELAFGPFNVALAATVREDIVGGRSSRLRTGTRALTVVLLVGVSAVVLGSRWVRHLLADDLATVGLGAVAAYCGYKAVTTVSTWLSVRHMIWAAPRRFLVSAIGSRVLALAGIAASVAFVRHTAGLFIQLMIAEVLVVMWYCLRMRSAPTDVSTAARSRSTDAPAAGAPASRPAG